MYVEVSEVEEFAGIAYTDLKVAGRTMTQEEWQQFVLTYQTPIAELIHRYCRVQTFDPFSSNAQVIEYKSGRGNDKR